MTDQPATLTSDAAAAGERGRVIQAIQEHEADLRALGVERLWLFGSLARDDAGADSDVDLMIRVPAGRKFSLFDLGEVRVALCERLGRDVDVVIEEDLASDFCSASELLLMF